MKVIEVQHQFNAKFLPHMVMKGVHFFSTILTECRNI